MASTLSMATLFTLGGLRRICHRQAIKNLNLPEINRLFEFPSPGMMPPAADALSAADGDSHVIQPLL